MVDTYNGHPVFTYEELLKEFKLTGNEKNIEQIVDRLCAENHIVLV
jgi:hypothetical protein